MNEKAYKFSVRDDTTFRAGESSGSGSTTVTINATNVGDKAGYLCRPYYVMSTDEEELFGRGAIILNANETFSFKIPLINGAAVIELESDVEIENTSENIEIITDADDGGLLHIYLVATGDGDISFTGTGGPK